MRKIFRVFLRFLSGYPFIHTGPGSTRSEYKYFIVLKTTFPLRSVDSVDENDFILQIQATEVLFLLVVEPMLNHDNLLIVMGERIKYFHPRIHWIFLVINTNISELYFLFKLSKML